MSRIGQVWWARHDSIVAEFELCVVLRKKSFNQTIESPTFYGWLMRPLERLDDHHWEFGHFESQFRLVEGGGADAWLKGRFA